MPLAELEPRFLRRNAPGTWATIQAIGDADGVMFLCPVCFQQNAGPVGTHVVLCWRPRVPLTESPGPGRWEFEGTGLADLSLVAGSSSVFLTSPGGCGAHFHVRSGMVTPA